MYRCLAFVVALMVFMPTKSRAQFDETQTGAWYMYFWNTTIKAGPWGFQGDVQHRNWNTLGDLEQLLLRGGVTYQPKGTKAKFTLGYGNITTGAFGDSKTTTGESRIYQELLLQQQEGKRFYLRHRFRYEQRFVDNQDMRTRFRYAFFVSVPINQPDLKAGAIYLALYDELFVNGERAIGDNRTVELFDRNRAYAAIGYGILDNLKVQAGYMRQTTDNWVKNQLQLSLHHKL